MKAKKGMTLLELLIVMAILGILFVLLLRTYNWISTMVFRVQQEKEVSQEVMQISQIIQNFADRNSIDYNAYGVTSDPAKDTSFGAGEGGVTRLVDTKGITEVLYLSGQDGEVVIYSSGNCIDPATEMVYREFGSDCSLYIDVGGKTREIINTKKISISKVVFKVIPFASEQQYIADPLLCDGIYLQCLNSPGFRMVFSAYSPNYGTQWATRVHVPFQQFF